MKLPKELDGKIFTLRLLNENGLISDPRIYMVSKDAKEIFFAATVLDSVVKNNGENSAPVIELWDSGKPTPSGIIRVVDTKNAVEGAKSEERADKKESNKPEGLDGDVSISDILIEAFEAINKTRNGG